MGDIVIEFKTTGPCIVDVKEVAKAWDYRFFISEYENDFQLIQFLRKGSDIRKLKVTISPEQAQDIIQELQLVRDVDGSPVIFAWRKEGQSFLDMRMKKRVKK
jgi:hypothetical protein